MKSQFSPLWYRVESLRPRLRKHVQLFRHLYRGQVWYVITDPSSGRVHRFTPTAYQIIGHMDGKWTVHELWEAALAKMSDAAPTQDEMIHLLGQLHAADVLQSDVTPDTAEILERYQQQNRARKINPLLRPLSIRLPLIDPERFLTHLTPFFRPFFNLWGALVWIAVIAGASVLAKEHWQELTGDIFNQVLTPQNLVLVWLIFPFVKVIHELGHAVATQVWGGEVHEMGIMFLVFSPIPYVDVSASAALSSRSRRIIIAAAGMGVELLVAALALFVWIAVEPGPLRNIAYNVILISGISTLFFNANPLVRFDGYYILSDLIEIPNLGQRSAQYFKYLVDRRLFGLQDGELTMETPGERAWLIIYMIASGCYRIFIFFAIIFGIAAKSLLLGMILGLWVFISMLAVPGAKGLHYLFKSPQLAFRRPRAVGLSALVLSGLVAMVCLVPAPLRSLAEGVVWLPSEAFVRPETDGFIVDLVTPPWTVVPIGAPLIKNYDPLLSAQVRALEAKVGELEARYRAAFDTDRVQLGQLQEQLGHQRAALARARERFAQLLVKSGEAGRFIVPQPEDLPGRFVRKGETIGYVVSSGTVSARVVVPQKDISLVRTRTRCVAARLVQQIERIYPVTLMREVPEALEYLPSKVLSVEGGGQMVVDPRETSGTKTFSRTFQFDIQLPLQWSQVHIGERVYVRFDCGWEPLAFRWYRSLRQLFLSRLDV